MGTANQHPAALAACVRALTELPDDEKAIYRARYLENEARDATCKRLNIGESMYDQRLQSAMRSLRRMVSQNVQPGHEAGNA